jgi:thiol-disulfide isomerase/thioredoxin
MRGAGIGLIAAVLALTGCKATDPKGDDKSPGITARNKNKDKDKDKDAIPAKGPAGWLDDVSKLPGAGTSVPKAGDSNLDPKSAAQDALGGRVLDLNGKPARNVYIRLEQVGTAPGGPAPIGIYTNNEGYFFTRGLKPGKAYDLTAEATQDGKTLTGVVQTKVPNPILLIVLRDDLPLSGGGFPAPKGPDGTFPPTPRPSDKVGDGFPRAPGDNSWTPGGPVTGVPPATIGAPKPPAGGGSGGALPPPDDLRIAPDTKPPVKPENFADGPKDPFKPPVTSVPGPVGPPVPPLPPPPSFGPGGRSSMGLTPGTPGKWSLIDTLERPWDLTLVRPGALVLVEFTTSSCIPCKQVIPVMKDLQSRYGASGLQVAAVLCDNAPQQERIATAVKYGRENNLNYALYIEPGAAGSVRDQFDVEAYPHAVLLNASGKVLWRGHPGKKAELESAIKQNLGK